MITRPSVFATALPFATLQPPGAAGSPLVPQKAMGDQFVSQTTGNQPLFGGKGKVFTALVAATAAVVFIESAHKVTVPPTIPPGTVIASEKYTVDGTPVEKVVKVPVVVKGQPLNLTFAFVDAVSPDVEAQTIADFVDNSQDILSYKGFTVNPKTEVVFVLHKGQLNIIPKEVLQKR